MTRLVLVLFAVLLSSASLAHATCILADDGTGTIALPPDCLPESYRGDLDIVEGLPAGGGVEMSASLSAFASTTTIGGVLGGTIEDFTATMQLSLTGTGSLAGLDRLFTIPITGEMHVADHPTGIPFQSFPVTIYRMRGKVTNDHDFALLEFEGGDVYGLDSPGQTTLSQLPNGDFQVESFFDFNYRIQFEGARDSQYIDGYRGITLDLDSTFDLESSVTAVEDPRFAGLSLHAYPNPVAGHTTLSAAVSIAMLPARVSIFDLRGRRVRSWSIDSEQATLLWDRADATGRAVAAGTYFVVLGTNDNRLTRKLTVVD